MKIARPLSRARAIVNRRAGPGRPGLTRRACRARPPCYPRAMIDDRLISAIDRLERAVATIEAALPAALQPPPTAPAADSPTDDDSHALRERYDRLEERHAALRQRTSVAVERLSQLLDSAQGE